MVPLQVDSFSAPISLAQEHQITLCDLLPSAAAVLGSQVSWAFFVQRLNTVTLLGVTRLDNCTSTCNKTERGFELNLQTVPVKDLGNSVSVSKNGKLVRMTYISVT